MSEVDVVDGAVEVADEVVGPAAEGAKLALITPLQKIRAMVESVQLEGASAKWDIETTKGEDAARAFRARCVSIRTSADAAYTLANKPLLEIQAEARKLRDTIKAEIQAVEDVWDSRIRAKEKRKAEEKAAREKAEREREAAIRKSIADISASVLSVVAADSSAIEARLKEVQAIEITADTFGLFVDAAEGARLRATTELNMLLAKAVQREQEARQIEEERRELARQQKEIERQRLEAERLVREGKARADAEQRRIDEARMAEELRAAEVAAAEQARIAEARAAEERRVEAERAQRMRLEEEAERQREAERLELKRQQDAFEEEKRIERERIEAERRREAEAEAERRAEADRIVAEREAAAAAGMQGAGTKTEGQPDAASRPSDAEILAVICSAYQVSELTALSWISELDVAAESNRIRSAT